VPTGVLDSAPSRSHLPDQRGIRNTTRRVGRPGDRACLGNGIRKQESRSGKQLASFFVTLKQIGKIGILIRQKMFDRVCGTGFARILSPENRNPDPENYCPEIAKNSSSFLSIMFLYPNVPPMGINCKKNTRDKYLWFF